MHRLIILILIIIVVVIVAIIVGNSSNNVDDIRNTSNSSGNNNTPGRCGRSGRWPSARRPTSRPSPGRLNIINSYQLVLAMYC